LLLGRLDDAHQITVEKRECDQSRENPVPIRGDCEPMGTVANH